MPWGRKGWVQDWGEKEDHLEEGGKASAGEAVGLGDSRFPEWC